MGTRSLTVFMDGKKEVVVMYRQFDGYPSGHGKDLASFLEGMQLVNGIPCGSDAAKEQRMANGMGCLAAQVVANFKKEVGSFYLYPAGSRDCGEEYIYTVSGEKGEPHIAVYDVYDKKTLFAGSASTVLAAIDKDDES